MFLTPDNFKLGDKVVITPSQGADLFLLVDRKHKTDRMGRLYVAERVRFELTRPF